MSSSILCSKTLPLDNKGILLLNTRTFSSTDDWSLWGVRLFAFGSKDGSTVMFRSQLREVVGTSFWFAVTLVYVVVQLSGGRCHA